MWWIVGGLLLVYLAASRSRTRKQRIVRRALSRAVRQEIAQLYARRFGNLDRPIDPRESEALVRAYFTSLLEFYDAQDFASLMRAMTVRADEGYDIERRLLDRLVAMVPGTASDPVVAATERSRLKHALESAGQQAMAAGRESGEV